MLWKTWQSKPSCLYTGLRFDSSAFLMFLFLDVLCCFVKCLTWCLPWLWWFDSLRTDRGLGGTWPLGLWCGHHSERPLKGPGCSACGRSHCGRWDPRGQRYIRIWFVITIYAVCPCGSPVDKSGHCGSPALLRLVIAVPFELPPDSK